MSRSLRVSQCLGIMTWLSGVGLSEGAHERNDGEPLSITLRVFNHAKVSPRILTSAQRQATRIFRTAGVEMLWLDCAFSSDGAGFQPACDQALEPITFLVRIVRASPATKSNFGADTLGITAQPEKGTFSSAAVFYDRVAELARGGGPSLETILGHALAHEIGHLLLGSNSHSPMGLMRAKWTWRDLQRAADGGLLFTPRQAGSIRDAVFKRHAPPGRVSATSLP